MDLFDQLSERGEMLDQLGRDGVALRVAAWLYAAITALLSFAMISAKPPLMVYLSTFLILTAFFLLTILLSEAGNSLVNPIEGLVLVHQPIDGATYTAAKLMHLLRIVFYLAPAINALPALLGLRLNGATWLYPVVHFSLSVGVALLAALLCCAVYGWLIRLLPATRLKAAGQLAAAMPLLVMPWIGGLGKRLARLSVAPLLPPMAQWALLTAGIAIVVGIVLLGLRALSADYLIRVSGIVHGQGTRQADVRRSRSGDMIARFVGGPPARAGFAYVLKLARRDFQFRRQMLGVSIGTIGLLLPAVTMWPTDPFSNGFTIAHLLPHALGSLLFFTCSFLTFGSDFKAAWFFLLVPAYSFRGFARGIYAALCMTMIVFPHLVLLPVFAWSWGLGHALLFIAYSAAVTSFYLAMELHMIDSVPFSNQVDPKRAAAMLPLIILGGAAIAIAVAVQYLIVFRMPLVVTAVTGCLAAAAGWLTLRALDTVESSMRHSLRTLANEAGNLYIEIDL